jgi:extracellular factor (EF) 3-hydroxypalmitic acid methyl ester biosynthesis protein
VHVRQNLIHQTKQKMQNTTPISTQIAQHDFIVAEIETLIEQGGPRPHQYAYADYLFEEIGKKLKAEELPAEVGSNLLKQCSFLQTSDSIMGHIRNKPYGYAGDFMIIERIYLNEAQPSTSHFYWDQYSLEHVAAKAVRNRKDYFKHTISNRIEQSAAPLRLLDVASGPARDLKELFETIKPECMEVTCVEMDSRAIEHATNINASHAGEIKFINQNIFKFRTEERFNIVWSAGLFDYFCDRSFVLVLKKLIEFATEDGEIIIGNFSNENPSRIYMEMVGDWILNHRSAQHLTELAIAAGAHPHQITVGKEPEGINLFLHIKKGEGK